MLTLGSFLAREGISQVSPRSSFEYDPIYRHDHSDLCASKISRTQTTLVQMVGGFGKVNNDLFWKA